MTYYLLESLPSRWFGPLVGAALGIACCTYPVIAADSPSDGRSDRLRYLAELESAWKERIDNAIDVDRAPSGKDRANAIQYQLSMLVLERCKEDSGQVKLVDVLSDETLPDFANSVATTLTGVLIVKGKRELVVRLLSHRCPPYNGNWAVERVTSLQPVIPDGFVMLCDAFDASSNGRVRAELVAAMRRALNPLGVDETNNARMVQQARVWYLANKAMFKPNYDYGPSGRPRSGPGGHVNPREALFVRRE